MTDQPLPLKPSNDLDADLRKLGYVPEVIALKGDVFARVCYEREELKDKLALAQAIVERQRVHLSQHLEHKEWLKAKIQEQASKIEGLKQMLSANARAFDADQETIKILSEALEAIARIKPDHTFNGEKVWTLYPGHPGFPERTAQSALDRVKGK